MAGSACVSITLVVAMAVAVFASEARAAEGPAEPYRRLEIQERENGYSNLKTMAVLSKDQLDGLLKQVADTSQHWRTAQKFTQALTEPKIDFATEALVLLCHDEGSGSVQVEFQKPLFVAHRLVCKIKRVPPSGVGTADMAYYAYALVIKRVDIETVEFQVNGRSTVLKVEAPEPTGRSAAAPQAEK